jgi:hypothetical protein
MPNINSSGSFITILALLTTLIFAACTGTPAKKENQAPVKPEIPEGWTSLFDGENLGGWEITNFGPQGAVYVSSGRLVMEMGDAITGVNWTREFPTMNYEIYLEAMRVDGHDFFCGMTFPVSNAFCSLIVGGWAGTTVGLSSIDGLDASENETTTLRKFEKGTWYAIRLAVTPGKIEAWIDNEQVVNFNTEGRTLSIRPEVGLSRPFGITSWRTTAALRNIRLKVSPGSEENSLFHLIFASPGTIYRRGSPKIRL